MTHPAPNGRAAFAPVQLRGAAHATVPPRLNAFASTVPDIDAPDAAALVAAARASAEREIELEAARAAGFAAGRAAAAADAAASHEAAQTAALATIAQALSSAGAALPAAVAHAAEAVTRTLLAALDAALPEVAARTTAERTALLIAACAPVLEAAGQLHVTVAPDWVDACTARVDDPRVSIEGDAVLAPGDARARWAGGGAALEWTSARAVLRELIEGLRED